jgi:predicted DNA-binding transcriptional regulator AlpA
MNIMENQSNTDETLLTRSEVMTLLRIGSVTMWRYTRRGKFPMYRAGRQQFFKKSEILNAIKVDCHEQ